jgi:hypothetical protein
MASKNTITIKFYSITITLAKVEVWLASFMDSCPRGNDREHEP